MLAIAPLSTGAMAQSNYPYPVPPAGDCRAMIAAGGTVWEGEFSGYYEDVADLRHLLYVKGCFRDERACRRWINEVQSFAVFPGLMRCRRIR